jgi:hypothetical protein
MKANNPTSPEISGAAPLKVKNYRRTESRIDTVDPVRAESIRRHPPEVMNIAEAAAFLTVSPSKVRVDIQARRLRCVRLGGRVIMRLCDLRVDLDRLTVGTV